MYADICVWEWFKSRFYIEKKGHLSFWIWLISLNLAICRLSPSHDIILFFLYGWIKFFSVCASRCLYPFDVLMAPKLIPLSFEWCCSKWGCGGVSADAGLASCEYMPKSGPARSHGSSLFKKEFWKNSMLTSIVTTLVHIPMTSETFYLGVYLHVRQHMFDEYL